MAGRHRDESDRPYRRTEQESGAYKGVHRRGGPRDAVALEIREGKRRGEVEVGVRAAGRHRDIPEPELKARIGYVGKHTKSLKSARRRDDATLRDLNRRKAKPVKGVSATLAAIWGWGAK